MIIIRTIKTVCRDGASRLSADIDINGKSRTLWFSADCAEDFLPAERSDPFVLALLTEAMSGGSSIVCDTPISERLYFQITEYLMPMLAGKNKGYSTIKIDVPPAAWTLPSQNLSGTLTSLNPLTIECGEEKTVVSTNCRELNANSDFASGFLIDIACVLAMQGLLDECAVPITAGTRFSRISLEDGTFGLFALNCISTESLTFVPKASEYTAAAVKGIHIAAPYIEKRKDGVCLCAEVSFNGQSNVLWFKVDEEYGKYLTADRSDPFAAALLTTAMELGQDIVCKAPLTESLLKRLNGYLIPVMAANIEKYSKIKVHGGSVKGITENAGAVGVGCTCGVDSMLTLMEHHNSRNFPLTHLICVCNGTIEGEHAHDTHKKMTAKMQSGIGRETGLSVIGIDTNIQDLLDESFLKIQAFRHTAVSLALQKLFRGVLWSSGHRIDDFQFIENRADYYESAVYNSFTTHSTAIYSAGCSLTRMQKLERLAEYPLAHRYLHPCIYALRENDSSCGKCLRTMAGLYALGVLDRFGEVFDVGRFGRNKNEYFRRLLKTESNPDEKEILALLRRRGKLQGSLLWRVKNSIRSLLKKRL